MQRYWCYICQRNFPHNTSESPIQCPFCHEMATEQVTQEINPQQIPIQTVTNQPQGDILWSQMFRSISMGMSDFIGSIRIQFQSTHSSAQAATPQQLQQLIKVSEVQQCAICQSNECQKQGYKLGCGHIFHQLCLQPWLNRANTCPKCRLVLHSI